jgi:hypothetical protein
VLRQQAITSGLNSVERDSRCRLSLPRENTEPESALHRGRAIIVICKTHASPIAQIFLTSKQDTRERSGSVRRTTAPRLT